MRVVIIEDDMNKAKQLREFMATAFSHYVMDEARSYQTGLKKIEDTHPDLVLLDMSMPTFDVTPQDKGGRTRGYAGRDILDEMKRQRISGKVIIVTQYETFGEGKQRQSLDEIKEELDRQFSDVYVGAVYYHPAQSDWQRELSDLIQNAHKKRRKNDPRFNRRRRRP